jgi:hypothetical protein
VFNLKLAQIKAANNFPAHSKWHPAKYLPVFVSFSAAVSENRSGSHQMNALIPPGFLFRSSGCAALKVLPGVLLRGFFHTNTLPPRRS